ncbi:unnamed protein product [Boreogadus saida]
MGYGCSSLTEGTGEAPVLTLGFSAKVKQQRAPALVSVAIIKDFGWTRVRSNLVWLGPLRSPRPHVQDNWAAGSSRGRDPTAEAPADEPAGGKVVIIC